MSRVAWTGLSNDGLKCPEVQAEGLGTPQYKLAYDTINVCADDGVCNLKLSESFVHFLHPTHNKYPATH